MCIRDSINDVLATRTKEESGDYYVKKFTVDVRENLDDGFNNGVYAAGATTGDCNTGSEENVAIQLSSGSAYVSGYRTERLSTTYKDVDKPRTFTGADNQSITTDVGNYIFLTNASEVPTIYEDIELRDEILTTAGTAAGNTIGRTRVLNVAYESGTVNTATTVYRANILDTKFYTKLNCQGGINWHIGDFVVGRTSGATGYVAVDANGASANQEGYLIDVTGNFVQNEYLDLNKANSGTQLGQLDNNAASVITYDFRDVKSYKYGTNGCADAVSYTHLTLPTKA